MLLYSIWCSWVVFLVIVANLLLWYSLCKLIFNKFPRLAYWLVELTSSVRIWNVICWPVGISSGASYLLAYQAGELEGLKPMAFTMIWLMYVTAIQIYLALIGRLAAVQSYRYILNQRKEVFYFRDTIELPLLLREEVELFYRKSTFMPISSAYFGKTMTPLDFYNRVAIELKRKVMYAPELGVNGGPMLCCSQRDGSPFGMYRGASGSPAPFAMSKF